MKPDTAFHAATAAKVLLREGRSGALATLTPGSGDPYCSLVNVATAADGSPLFLLSKLALHTKNILADPRASLMIDERKDGDPLEGARIMIMGSVAVTDEAAARARYLARHPDAYMFAGFGDFAFYKMSIKHVHIVAGFGRIDDLTAAQIVTDISGAEALLEAEEGAVKHMNEDHADALRLYATKLRGAPDGDWRCTGLDPDGIDLLMGRTGLRLDFPQRVSGPGPLRAVLKQLADKARSA